MGENIKFTNNAGAIIRAYSPASRHSPPKYQAKRLVSQRDNQNKRECKKQANFQCFFNDWNG